MPNTSIHKTVVFIGAGNVATHLSQAMKNAGFSILQIFSRTTESAKRLADISKCSYTTDIKKILPDADIYIFALKDDILQSVIEKMPANNGLWIHTAGSVNINIFNGFTERYGVIYPMQTLSVKRIMDFSKVPLFIEGNTSIMENEVRDIAAALSHNVTCMNSEKRRYLHLAAVFACNFSNHMYVLATQILKKRDIGIDHRILQPLIDETASKLYSMSPQEAQTGPAIRYDRNIIDRHLSMLDDENIRNLYITISECIHSNC